MIDKERWNIRTDRDKMGKSIKYNILVQYKKFILKKTSSSIKQSIHPMNDCFLRLWINAPRPNWEIHMGWENWHITSNKAWLTPC